MWKNNGRRIQVAMLMLLVVALLLGVGGPAHAAAKTTVTVWTFLNPEAADPRSKAL